MTIKDLPEKTNLEGIIVQTPDGIIGKWVSQWPGGVWLQELTKVSGHITPIFVEDLKECLDWKIINLIQEEYLDENTISKT